ncbi:MAG: 2,3-bisphosphoglycerate-independent phosphoglycerate mutase [Flavobacteriales bacterium]|jgi:2,3-bisphosphoglycerate-independent phosphoglycerate mutase|uniref:2,3-bisphosphoglycerate-independent phosphoglycerate mutase n=1 Tax=Blattabacterium sp. (Mastotermes darwiniensis) TaxID=39768 RepID=UPI000231DE79|nr:2,3-bisphosphoglycerate-independent phosphoglycerate mutase [Blattabacterium sp. (Mastotermes darwiniensis)]AER40685.1 phosphoglyceromutase [Blattabacterium sp. (Mastotermes darwiniensis) str. MADAR]MDR1804787.1 2,3-bisphosphoglycerate-independent phosphoglycerate mutase [Flavobacteriales bacterium]
MKKLVLIILDGWGLSCEKFSVYSSAIEIAKTPFMDYCYKFFPYSKLRASGTYVGLPEKQMGNSEVGHINLGSGRKVIQSLEKINESINRKLFQEKIKPVFDYVVDSGKRIHFIGLLSDGGVHSHMNHLLYLLRIAHEKNIKKVFVHVFTDGRDTSPKKGVYYLKNLLDMMKKYVGELSTIVGRYYSMDRDQRWDRIRIAYDAMVHSKGFYCKTSDVIKHIEKSYNKGITDEFLLPIIVVDNFGHPISRIEKEDVVFCFNFRSDRSRQITEILTNNIKEKNTPFSGIRKLDLYYITMTCYNPIYKNIDVLFEKENLSNTLGEILEKEGKKQIRIAETEKYPHVTFFFSGGRESNFNGETRILCESPKVSTYDLQPEMSARKIVNKIVPELRRKEVDFVCLNFANPDMVGHTGKMKETIKACEFVDHCTNICVIEAMKNLYTVVIVGDHGNADCMINTDGTPNTSHSNSLVPFILLSPRFKNRRNIFLRKEATLSDVAPTILQLMKLPKPNEMSGFSIIKKIKNG